MEPISLKGFDLAKEDYIRANRQGEIVRLGVCIPTPPCNLRCMYCLNGEGTHVWEEPEAAAERPRATLDDYENWIDQARELNSRCIIVDGVFEPLMNRDFCLRILEHVRRSGMVPMLVTNGTLVTRELARELYSVGTTVITKLNFPMVTRSDKRYATFVAAQDELCGLKNHQIYDTLVEAVQILIESGFSRIEMNPAGKMVTRMGIQTVIYPLNYSYILELFDQARKRNLYVHAETIKPQGRAESEDKFHIDAERIADLFERIREQHAQMGIETGSCTPPLAVGSCLRHMATVNVRPDGNVIPCPSIELVLGNLFHTTLREIIADNPHVEILRNLPKRIQGDCARCSLLESLECYGGCRGYTYMSFRRKGHSKEQALTASDPYCWKVSRCFDSAPDDALKSST